MQIDRRDRGLPWWSSGFVCVCVGGEGVWVCGCALKARRMCSTPGWGTKILHAAQGRQKMLCVMFSVFSYTWKVNE